MSEESTATTKKEVHVTELVGPDDHWVSVTDASRIARRQEHTIRTWIAQGVLPVHPVRVGINKKTRRVRLSDLATLTPILDPDAGIATDLGTLDLPSIPKQQQHLAEQMTALQQETTRQFATLSEQCRGLAGEHETFAEETRQAWDVSQQQYQALARRDEEQQQLIQQVRDTGASDLRDVDLAMRQELGNVARLHALLDERIKTQEQTVQQTHQELRDLIARTAQALRQASAEQVEQSTLSLRQEWTDLLAHAELVLRQESAETVELIRKELADLQERMGSALTRLQAHTDQQFTQMGVRLQQGEETMRLQQNEFQRHSERVGHLETQVAGMQSSWQERAMTAEQEARQVRRDLDAHKSLQQALQQQLDEERKAREELTRQVSKLLQQSQ
jgi:hypothetical protein